MDRIAEIYLFRYFTKSETSSIALVQEHMKFISQNDMNHPNHPQKLKSLIKLVVADLYLELGFSNAESYRAYRSGRTGSSHAESFNKFGFSALDGILVDTLDNSRASQKLCERLCVDDIMHKELATQPELLFANWMGWQGVQLDFSVLMGVYLYLGKNNLPNLSNSGQSDPHLGSANSSRTKSFTDSVVNVSTVSHKKGRRHRKRLHKRDKTRRV